MTKLPLLLLSLAVLLSPVVVIAEEQEDDGLYEIKHAPLDILTEGTWIFHSEVVLPVSLDDCWDIITDDGAWQFWHPEVTEITNTVGDPGTVGSERTIVYNGIKINEWFDIWEEQDGGDDNRRRYSFFFSAASLPGFLGFKMLREDYTCQRITDSKSLFQRTVAMEPGLLFVSFFYIVYPQFQRTFEQLCPLRMLESIEAGDLPRPAGERVRM